MCGVLGIQSTKEGIDVRGLALEMLLRLQHRGQDGAGIAVWNCESSNWQIEKGKGLVPSALANWQKLPESRVALAHTRYATTGAGTLAEVQPFLRGKPRLAVAHNGNIFNRRSREDILEHESLSDLEEMSVVFLKALSEGGFEGAAQKLLDQMEGAYAFVGFDEKGNLFGVRDPFGIRPLYLGRCGNLRALASETQVFELMSAQQGGAALTIEEIPPSSAILLKENGEIEQKTFQTKWNPKQEERFCMFEGIYFSSPLSRWKEKSVYQIRFELGSELAQVIAKEKTHSVDYVVPVPETSRTAAIAVAEALQVPFREFLVKNPYVSRTFILPSQNERLGALRLKMGIVGPAVLGKNILLVDDSVVRGNTSRVMAEELLKAGAARVEMASTCPEISYPCFYGIDFPDEEELIARPGKTHEQIAKEIGIEKIYYLKKEQLLKVFGGKKICMACVDGQYPVWTKAMQEFKSARVEERKKHEVTS